MRICTHPHTHTHTHTHTYTYTYTHTHTQLYIGRTGSCADIGVVAREDIPRATVLAEIPRHTLLNGRTSRVGPALVSDRAFSSQRKTVNSWVPLLLALLAEYDEKVDLLTQLSVCVCVCVSV